MTWRDRLVLHGAPFAPESFACLFVCITTGVLLVRIYIYIKREIRVAEVDRVSAA